MAEQFLDLAEVRASAQQLGGEHVAQRVRRDALAVADPGGVGVAAERRRHDRRRQPAAVGASEQRALMPERQADGEVGVDQRHQRGVEGHDALPAALGSARADQAAVEVEVVPIEGEQFGAAQAAVGEQREHQPVAFVAAGESALPHLTAPRGGEQPAQLAAVEHVGQRVALLRRAEHRGRIPVEVLVLDAEAKEAPQRGDRAGLARGAGRWSASAARNRRRCATRTAARSCTSIECRNVVQARTSRAYALHVNGASRRSISQ